MARPPRDACSYGDERRRGRVLVRILTESLLLDRGSYRVFMTLVVRSYRIDNDSWYCNSILGEPWKVKIDKFSFGRGSKRKLWICLGSILMPSPYILLWRHRGEIVFWGKNGGLLQKLWFWNESQGIFGRSGFRIEFPKNYCRYGIRQALA